ncbi:hypothetical protein D3C80_1506210 [compost metagenome]
MTISRRVLLTRISSMAIMTETIRATKPRTEITSSALMLVALVICASDTSNSSAQASRAG